MKGGKLTDQYFELVKEYEEKYGPKTVVFIQKGDFMELYGLNNETEKISDIENVCKFLDIACGFTNSTDLINKPGNTRDNPLFGGVNVRAYPKYVRKLLDGNYNVIEYIETEKNSDGTKKRELNAIISKGCYIEEESNTSNVVCVFSELIRHHRTNEKIMTIGLSCIDVTTGKSTVYETYDKEKDPNFAMNEAYRFIQVCHPKQVLFCDSTENNELIKHIELQENDYTIIKQNKENEKLEYQKQLYEKLFPCNGNVLEHINLARYNLASTSYVYLLNYVYERNKSFLDNLKVPIFWNESSHMLLHHNTIYQLDLYSREKTKPSLCRILNKCRTKPGQRLFEDRLLNPLTKVKSIEKRYNCIDVMMNTEKIDEFTKLLDGIYDTERLFRRLSMQTIQPIELHKIYQSINNLSKIIHLLKLLEIGLFSFKSFYKKMKEFKKYFEDTFILDNLKRYSKLNKEVDFSIYKEGVHDKIDEVVKSQDYMNEFRLYLQKMEMNHKKEKRNLNKICFGFSKEKKDYVVTITRSRFRQYEATTTLTDKKYLEFKNIGKGNNLRLTNSYIEELSQKIKLSNDSLNDLIQEYYKLHIEKINKEFGDIYYSLSKFIANFDVNVNNAIIAKKFCYCKPKIDTEIKESYMELKQMRHPIVERIRPEEKYVANDVTIGKDESGIILFGPNAGGKSTTLKALGIVAIMAQAGMYVPCRKMKYSLYENISSRILGNDDLSKGQSSFEVEMIELNHILRRSTNKSLVLGDEICRGTTTIDALSLVASSIVELSNRKTNFMYTTHLHKLKDLECVKKLDNVGIYHIKVRIENDKVIYDRTLQPGNGSTMYGIEIARAMNMDSEFIKNAYAVRDILLNQESFILSQKASKYNKDLYMGRCEICKDKAEDTHHIGFQCMANEEGLIDYYHKNDKHNLVNLCKKCHTMIHQYKFKIKGWLATSEGRELDYEKLVGEEREEYKKQIDVKISTIKKEKANRSIQKDKDVMKKKMERMLQDKEAGKFTSIEDYL